MKQLIIAATFAGLVTQALAADLPAQGPVCMAATTEAAQSCAAGSTIVISVPVRTPEEFNRTVAQYCDFRYIVFPGDQAIICVKR